MAKRTKTLTIGQRIERSGKTRTELAQEVGVSRPYMSQIASGTRKPGAAILARLADALNCKPADLRPELAAVFTDVA